MKEYSELFGPTTLTTPSFTGSYSISAPVRQSTTTLFTLPGNLAGAVCQENVEVLFGVDRDVTCASSVLNV